MLLVLMLGVLSQVYPAASYTRSCEVIIPEACSTELGTYFDCSVCAAENAPECSNDTIVKICREAVAANAPDPQDPPFDLSRVLFAGSFGDHGVLQRGPGQASVYGTAKPGATVTVTLAGPNSFKFQSPPTTVAISSDKQIHGTWRVLLPARGAGFGYTLEASCAGCPNTTSVALSDIGFGDVFLCSGQSNMEDPVLTTVSRNESYAVAANGTYDHIRLYQTGWRLQRKNSTWIMPQAPDDSQGYPSQYWQKPLGCADHRPGPGPTCSLQRFSAICWYFGKSLSDAMAEDQEPNAEPVPIGLIHSSIGGTTIQEWIPPSYNTNTTCMDNNCGTSIAMNTSLPKCTNSSQSTVWSCPAVHCSDLYHGMIAPFVNTTIAGVVWYQGEQNVHFGSGSLPARSGYACQQKALIDSWRQAFSATPGTTDPNMLFGVTTLASGCSEGPPLWSPYQHVDNDTFTKCTTGVYPRLAPVCKDMDDDWAAGLRVAQTLGYGHAPNAALPKNFFLGQGFDHGEPCNCDRHALPPGGCWANGQCYGWTPPYSLNRTWNYQNSGIHPRVKLPLGQRLARAAHRLMQSPTATPQPTPKLSGCRLNGNSLQITFDKEILGEETVSLKLPVPGKIPLQLRVGTTEPTNSSWVYASNLAVVNDSTIQVSWPSSASPPTAVKYAWADNACCPELDPSTGFCPPAACPIVTSNSQEPAVPFWAEIVNGRCHCDAPWACDA